MALLRQYINGKWVKTLNIQAGADEVDVVKDLAAGVIQEWDSKVQGGKKTELPAKLNTRVFRVGSKSNGQYRSCSFRVSHLEPTKQLVDVADVVIGKFDAHFDLEEKAEYCNAGYDRANK